MPAWQLTLVLLSQHVNTHIMNILLLLLLSLLLPVCTVFTIIYLKQAMFLRYIVAAVLHLYISTSRSLCAVPNMAVVCT